MHACNAKLSPDALMIWLTATSPMCPVVDSSVGQCVAGHMLRDLTGSRYCELQVLHETPAAALLPSL